MAGRCQTQVTSLLLSFLIPVAAEVQFVLGLYSNDGRCKAEVGLNRKGAALAIRKKYFSYVRPNRPESMPDFLSRISIHPSFTDATRVRVAILKVTFCVLFESIMMLDCEQFSR